MSSQTGSSRTCFRAIFAWKKIWSISFSIRLRSASHARTLLLLARYGKEEEPEKVLPKISQEVLAEMVGTTRSRVNFFMNKFRRLGLIQYNGALEVNSSLLSVVLHE